MDVTSDRFKQHAYIDDITTFSKTWSAPFETPESSLQAMKLKVKARKRLYGALFMPWGGGEMRTSHTRRLQSGSCKKFCETRNQEGCQSLPRTHWILQTAYCIQPSQCVSQN